MRQALIFGGIVISVLILPVLYLSLIGMDDQIERHAGCTVVFSDQDIAQQFAGVSTSFSPVKNIYVSLRGEFAGRGGLKSNEVKLTLIMTGHHRRRLFDPRYYYPPCSSTDLIDGIKREIVKLTSDTNLKLDDVQLCGMCKQTHGRLQKL